jgi:hypothetical protein
MVLQFCRLVCVSHGTAVTVYKLLLQGVLARCNTMTSLPDTKIQMKP